MMTNRQLRLILAGMVCLTAIPAAALAGSDYLQGKTFSRDPSEPRPLTPSEQQWQPPYTGGDPTREQKVEQRVQQYKQQLGLGENPIHDETHHMDAAAINNLVSRAQSGDADAMGQMGYNYQYGLGVEKNEKMAVEWYKRAIEYGAGEYHSAIGDIYRDYSSGQQKGFFSGIRGMLSGEDKNAVQKDNHIAREWYEKGINHNDWRAYTGLAELYRDGEGGVQKDLGAANSYYNQGLRVKQQRDAQEKMKLEREIRMRAEREIPIDPTAKEEQAPARTEQQPADNLPTIILGGERCSYSPSRLSRNGYSRVFDVRCPTLRGKQLTVDKASLPGLQCDIERIGGGNGGLLLLCKVAEEQGIRLGEAFCALRKEKDQQGFVAVYGAYCNKPAETGVGPIEYSGMACDVEAAAAGQGKTYTLKCAAKPKTPAETGNGATMSQRIGQYDCSLREIDAPQHYRKAYEAYCGGLSVAERNARSVPGTLTMGVDLCEVEPWPKNDEGKDFEVYCR